MLDLFDANALAHDPRTQCMNSALMTHGAYDYSADSRGYGLVAEYIGEGWSLRAGRFAEPKEPNQLKFDGRLLRHCGDQVEVTRDYEVGAQTGARHASRWQDGDVCLHEGRELGICRRCAAGKRWSRGQDTLGVGLAIGGLSGPHQTFLARGGQFLGDGALNYRPERDFEAYSSAAFAKGFTLTIDYQRIQNAGHNADRGLASLYSLRLHWKG